MLSNYLCLLAINLHVCVSATELNRENPHSPYTATYNGAVGAKIGLSQVLAEQCT